MHRISIKIEGIERRKRSTGLLHIVAGLFLIANATEYHKQEAYEKFFAVLPIFLVAAASLFYGFFRNKIDPNAQYNHWMRMLQFLMFSILGILLLKSKIEFRNISLFLWAAICIMLLFTERKIFHDAFLSLGKHSITIPGYFSNKVIPWPVVENIVVRQDYVTIYYPNNRYMQYEVIAAINEEEVKKINNFCKQVLQQQTEQQA